MPKSPDISSRINSSLQRPINEEEVYVEGVGAVIVTSNNDLDFDPGLVRAVTVGPGQFISRPPSGRRVRDVPGQQLVVRKQEGIGGDMHNLQQIVKWQAGQINTLRGLGIAVVKHASIVVPAGVVSHEPKAITIAQKIPGQNLDNNFDPTSTANASKVATITSAFQAYYTNNVTRTHLADISEPHQFSDDGQLMDLGINITVRVGDSPLDGYETCGEQLRHMYEGFKLSPEQIERLKEEHSMRPIIRLAPRPETTDEGPSGPNSTPSASSGTCTIEQVIAQLQAAKAKAEASAAVYKTAATLSSSAKHFFDGSVNPIRWELLANSTAALTAYKEWRDATDGMNDRRQMLYNLCDQIDEIIDRL